MMSGSSLGFTVGRTIALVVDGAASVSATVDPEAPSLMLLNMGPELVFVRIGTGAQVATAADFPVLPGMPVVIGKGVGADTIAAIGIPGPPPIEEPDEEAPPDEGEQLPAARAAAPQFLYVTAGHA